MKRKVSGVLAISGVITVLGFSCSSDEEVNYKDPKKKEKAPQEEVVSTEEEKQAVNEAADKPEKAPQEEAVSTEEEKQAVNEAADKPTEIQLSPCAQQGNAEIIIKDEGAISLRTCLSNDKTFTPDKKAFLDNSENLEISYHLPKDSMMFIFADQDADTQYSNDYLLVIGQGRSSTLAADSAWNQNHYFDNNTVNSYYFHKQGLKGKVSQIQYIAECSQAHIKNLRDTTQHKDTKVELTDEKIAELCSNP